MIVVGSLSVRTSTQLAEAAIDRIAREAGRSKKPRGVYVDADGVVSIGPTPVKPMAEWVYNANRATDPDDLADELRECIP